MSVCLPSELRAKLRAQTAAKQKVVERSEEAEHRASMLQLDIKSARDEIQQLRQALSTTQSKVGVAQHSQCPWWTRARAYSTLARDYAL